MPIIEIINGDIRVSSGSRINKGTTAQSSAMLLAAPSSGTSIFGQKRIPAIGDINTPVTSKLAGNDKSKANEFIFDNGKGLLSGSIGSGKINYETGAFELNTLPNATFNVSAYFNSALSGESTADRDNYIRNISAKSLNPFRDATIRIEAEDLGIDDSSPEALFEGSYR